MKTRRSILRKKTHTKKIQKKKSISRKQKSFNNKRKTKRNYSRLNNRNRKNKKIEKTQHYKLKGGGMLEWARKFTGINPSSRTPATLSATADPAADLPPEAAVATDIPSETAVATDIPSETAAAADLPPEAAAADLSPPKAESTFSEIIKQLRKEIFQLKLLESKIIKRIIKTGDRSPPLDTAEKIKTKKEIIDALFKKAYSEFDIEHEVSKGTLDYTPLLKAIANKDKELLKESIITLLNEQKNRGFQAYEAIVAIVDYITITLRQDFYNINFIDMILGQDIPVLPKYPNPEESSELIKIKIRQNAGELSRLYLSLINALRQVMGDMGNMGYGLHLFETEDMISRLRNLDSEYSSDRFNNMAHFALDKKEALRRKKERGVNE